MFISICKNKLKSRDWEYKFQKIDTKLKSKCKTKQNCTNKFNFIPECIRWNFEKIMVSHSRLQPNISKLFATNEKSAHFFSCWLLQQFVIPGAMNSMVQAMLMDGIQQLFQLWCNILMATVGFQKLLHPFMLPCFLQGSQENDFGHPASLVGNKTLWWHCSMWGSSIRSWQGSWQHWSWRWHNGCRCRPLWRKWFCNTCTIISSMLPFWRCLGHTAKQHLWCQCDQARFGVWKGSWNTLAIPSSMEPRRTCWRRLWGCRCHWSTWLSDLRSNCWQLWSCRGWKLTRCHTGSWSSKWSICSSHSTTSCNSFSVCQKVENCFVLQHREIKKKRNPKLWEAGP